MQQWGRCKATPLRYNSFMNEVFKPEIDPLKFHYEHNTSLPEEIREALLTEELTSVIDRVCPEEGDEALLYGSRAQMAYFGNPSEADYDIYTRNTPTHLESQTNKVTIYGGLRLLIGETHADISNVTEIIFENKALLINLHDQGLIGTELMVELALELDTLPMEELPKLLSFMTQDTVGIKFKRGENHAIETTIVDPNNTLTQYTENYRYYIEHGALPPTMETGINNKSILYHLLVALENENNISIDNIGILALLNSFPRAITQSAKVRSKVQSLQPSGIDRLSAITHKICDEVIKVTPQENLQKVLDDFEFQNLKEYVIHTLRSRFSRAALLNPKRALNFILGHNLESYIFPSLTGLIQEGDGTYRKVMDLCDRQYPEKQIEIMYPLYETPLNLEVASNQPENLNEVIALLLVSLELPRNYVDGITESIEFDWERINHRAKTGAYGTSNKNSLVVSSKAILDKMLELS